MFRSNFDSTPPPILIDAGVAVLENEKIERHIMKSVPGGHNLFVQVGRTSLKRWIPFPTLVQRYYQYCKIKQQGVYQRSPIYIQLKAF